MHQALFRGAHPSQKRFLFPDAEVAWCREAVAVERDARLCHQAPPDVSETWLEAACSDLLPLLISINCLLKSWRIAARRPVSPRVVETPCGALQHSVARECAANSQPCWNSGRAPRRRRRADRCREPPHARASVADRRGVVEGLRPWQLTLASPFGSSPGHPSEPVAQHVSVPLPARWSDG